MKLAVLLSLFLSILHSILFYGQKLGISVFLFTIVALFFFLTIMQKTQIIKNKKALLITIPIILLSTTYFIFNNFFFNIMNILVILFLFALMIIIATLGEVKPQRLMRNLFIIFLGPIEEMDNSIKEISNNCIKNILNKNNFKHNFVKQLLKSIIVSLPLLIIILVLLSSADETFASIFNNTHETLFNYINIQATLSLIFRLVIIVVLTIYFLGVILKIVNNKLDNITEKNRDIKIQGITLSTLLTLLNIIYLIFTGVQVIHIIEQMQNPNITNYSSYARNGFFQLMAVSIINFVIIIISKNNKTDNSTRIKRYIKAMNFALAIFTIIILVSSVLRMRLYEQEYGYTFLRIMVYWVQITELILILPTMIYILKQKFKIFNYFLIIITTMYVIINFVNIDFIIAKGNIDRYFSDLKIKREIDVYYLEKNTSIDAIPQMVRLLDAKDEIIKEEVYNCLVSKYNNLLIENNSWQSFNISKKNDLIELKKLDLENRISNISN